MEGGSYFCIIKRSRKANEEMVISQTRAQWLANIMEQCAISKGMKEFFMAYHNETKALVAH